jgi:hypothetical protein
MIDAWILDKLAPLKPSPLMVLRDPQRMIRPRARAVHTGAEENSYSVLFSTGNLGRREMYEAVRDRGRRAVHSVACQRT